MSTHTTASLLTLVVCIFDTPVQGSLEPGTRIPVGFIDKVDIVAGEGLDSGLKSARVTKHRTRCLVSVVTECCFTHYQVVHVQTLFS